MAQQIRDSVNVECRSPSPVIFEGPSWRDNSLARDTPQRSSFQPSLGSPSQIKPAEFSVGQETAHAVLSIMPGAEDRVKVELHQESLWKVFREQQTEMIITRAGRRMFPVLDFRLTGLDPEQNFSCMVQIVSADGYRYRYDLDSTTWVVTGSAVGPAAERCSYVHPHGSTLGKIWMKEGAKFEKLKLTNHIKPCCDHIVLSSLQKYKAQLLVTKFSAPQCERWVFDFPETEFIAVTCYQNANITKLKIDYNPFAKSFRQGKRPAKSVQQEERVEPQAKSAKRPRLCFASPPPITRYQSPFVNQYTNDVPTPPPTTVCTQTPVPCDMAVAHEAIRTAPRYIPKMGDPLLWEPAQRMIPQHPCLPPINTTFRFEMSGTFYKPDFTNQSLPFSLSDYQDDENFLPGSHNTWQSIAGCGLFEDVQLQHYNHDNMYWREN